ncbi:DUF2232 domain-containing protein [Peptostreptococcus faecalis]|uniref:DUF2232 domain-containing protein n=1 Tax=Peptostreptococcus faecalis TaxID=2045015 RepID=UPI0011AF41DE|nr:DUF2232 domain-containing protein [Peptostreptococcus faecalis]
MLTILIVIISIANMNQSLSFFMLLAIVPMVIISIKANMLFSISTIVVIVSTLFALCGSQVAVSSFFVYLLPSFLTGLFMNNEKFTDKDNRKFSVRLKKGEQLYKFASIKVFLFSIIFFVVGVFLYHVVMKYFMNVDLFKNMQQEITKMITIYKEIIPQEQLKELEKLGFFETLSDTGLIVLSGIYFKSIILAILAYYVSIPLIKKIYNEKIYYVTVENIFLPGNPVIVLFVSIVILFIIGSIYTNIDTVTIIDNFVLIMNMLFFLQGTSLIVYIFKNWSSIKKRVNWILFLAIVIIMGVLPGISTLGMLDNLLNYRGRWNSNGDNYGGRNEQ